jgi:mono/diheme cytochrome c family protein
MRSGIAILLVLLSGAPALAADLGRGRELVQAECGRCHAVGPTGDSPLKDAPPFREVVKRYEPALLAEALAEGIVTGHNDMPEFEFSPEDIGALVAYLEGLQTDR